MQETAQHFQKQFSPNHHFSSVVEPDAVAFSRLPRLIDDWLADCQISQHSPRTIELRRMLTGRLLWFLERQEALECGRREMRQFFAYLSTSDPNSAGRWDNAKYNKPLRPASVNTYYRHLGSFFNWLVNEEYITVSPLARITPPVPKSDQVQPFSMQQLEDLINAAKKSKYAARDEAIVRCLYDTGIRATELCQLRMKDIDLYEGKLVVLGKGNKVRTVYLGRKGIRSLRAYLRNETRSPEDAVFMAERGKEGGGPLTRSGLLQLVRRLGKAANIQVNRCSPHTFRHTFAVDFLRNGGNTLSLKHLLGHTTLQMTSRYVALAQADMQAQHRQFSPGDRLKS